MGLSLTNCYQKKNEENIKVDYYPEKKLILRSNPKR